ncbi:hypothetical protein ACFLW4_02815 [Chloroflexota bacterium]
MALMVSLLAVEILFFSQRKATSAFTLLKIIVIALSLTWSQLLIYATVVGVDPWGHLQFTNAILDKGYIPPGYGYSKFPVMHLIIATTSLITNLGYKMATMFSISLLQVICDLTFIFLLGKFVHSSKAGLLAALLLGAAGFHVHFGYWIIPNILGITLVIITSYLLLKLKREKPYAATLVILLLMGVLIFTHTLASATLALLLLVFWLGFKVYYRLYEERTNMPIQFNMVLLFPVCMFSWWMYSTGHLRTLVNMLRGGFGEIYWGDIAIPERILQHQRVIPFTELIFNDLGSLLFFAFALVGCLYMMNSKFGNKYGFALILGAFAPITVTLSIRAAGGFIVDSRWWYFSQILLSIFLAIAFLLLCSLLKHNLMKWLLLSILTFGLSFLMILSPLENMDNRAFSPNSKVRYGYTESESQAVLTLSTVWDGYIGVDRQYGHLALLPQLESVPLIKHRDESLVTQDFSELEDELVIIRREITEYPFNCYNSLWILDYDPYNFLSEQGFSHIYSCGTVDSYLLHIIKHNIQLE